MLRKPIVKQLLQKYGRSDHDPEWKKFRSKKTLKKLRSMLKEVRYGQSDSARSFASFAHGSWKAVANVLLLDVANLPLGLVVVFSMFCWIIVANVGLLVWLVWLTYVYTFTIGGHCQHKALNFAVVVCRESISRLRDEVINFDFKADSEPLIPKYKLVYEEQLELWELARIPYCISYFGTLMNACFLGILAYGSKTILESRNANYTWRLESALSLLSFAYIVAAFLQLKRLAETTQLSRDESLTKADKSPAGEDRRPSLFLAAYEKLEDIGRLGDSDATKQWKDYHSFLKLVSSLPIGPRLWTLVDWSSP